jgi:hypothetical protein
MTHTIRVDTGSCDHRPRCANCSTERSANKVGYARFAMNSSPITTTLCQTTNIRREWEERGETIIRTIFKQRTGGVTEKRDQPEWMTDGRSSR